MAIIVRKATRKKAKLRLGIAAPAGAGKTMGALLVAYGLCPDWDKIGLVDTEHGSGELYVNHHVPGTTLRIGEYLYARLDPPYTVAKYMEAQKALEEAGCEVVIHDSLSHAWAGEGGLLDKQGKLAAKSGNSYAAWRDVTPDHNRFVDMMLSSPAHIIATMRAKTEHVQEKDANGRTTVRKLGMSPVQRDGVEFEFSVMLDVDQQSHMASASKDRTSLLDGEYFKLSPEIGKRLLGWLEEGEAPKEYKLATSAGAERFTNPEAFVDRWQNLVTACATRNALDKLAGARDANAKALADIEAFDKETAENVRNMINVALTPAPMAEAAE